LPGLKHHVNKGYGTVAVRVTKILESDRIKPNPRNALPAISYICESVWVTSPALGKSLSISPWKASASAPKLKFQTTNKSMQVSMFDMLWHFTKPDQGMWMWMVTMKKRLLQRISCK
jgi:hypothetical protein